MKSFWIQKNPKVFEELFQTKVIINPLFDENALIKIDQGNLEGPWKMEKVWALSFAL